MRAVFFALGLVGCADFELPIHLDLFHDDPHGPSRVEVWVDAGRVDVQEGDETSVERRLRWEGDVAPESEILETAGTLVIDGNCPPRAVGCAVDVTLIVVPHTVVEVFTGAGDVSVRGLSGGVFVDTAAGVVDLDGLTGVVTAYTADGALRGVDLASPEIQTDVVGPVDLAFVVAPAVVDVHATADVTVAVPAGSYRLELASEVGEVVVTDVLSDDTSAHVISARTLSGDVAVQGR